MELSDAHLATLQSRLNYIAEIIDAVTQWSEDRDRSVFALLDDIECDLLVIIGSDSKQGQEDSTYIMHTSWPSDCSVAAMYESLPKRVVSAMTQGIGKILVMEPEATKWTASWGAAMEELARAFVKSRDLDQAMGRLLAIDVMLFNLLSFIGAMRLNPMLEK